MKIRHIKSLDLWLLSKGNKILYRGKECPWHSSRLLEVALRRNSMRLVG